VVTIYLGRIIMRRLLIKTPPTIARDYIVGFTHYIPGGEGIDIIYYEQDGIYLEGPEPEHAIKLAVKNIAEQIEKYKISRIPASGNDKRYKLIDRIFQCLQVSPELPIHNIFYKVADNLYSINIAKGCERFTLPSLLKPDIYEFNRTPGYVGSRKFDEEYPLESVLFSIAGYLGTRIGYTRFSRDAVLLIPEVIWRHEPSLELKFAVETFYEKIREGVLDISPEPAFILWLSLILRSYRRLSKLRIYVISEPAGANPATIKNHLRIDLEMFHESPLWRELVKSIDRREAIKERYTHELIDLLEMALSQRSDLAIKISIYLYETIVGAKSVEETYYIASRDFLTLKMRKGEIPKDVSLAYKVAEELRRAQKRLGG
jgi:hypothetical protein